MREFANKIFHKEYTVEIPVIIKDDVVTVTTNKHSVLKLGDICSIRAIHDTHYEVVRGEDMRHTSIAKDSVKLI